MNNLCGYALKVDKQKHELLFPKIWTERSCDGQTHKPHQHPAALV